MTAKYIIKILTLGDTLVGKSSIVLRFSDDKFDKAYWNFCENLFNKLPDDLEKRALENALLTHRGRKPRFGIEELTN